ncbi:hypothetical protein [Luteococcus peritonei]|uniref:Uncharacterized protein n=1 Tax=Luteococcus peritonei TaxID=88874 RepID=A0ABW4RW04_9ACTN
MTALICFLVATLWLVAAVVICRAQPRPADLAQLIGSTRAEEPVTV